MKLKIIPPRRPPHILSSDEISAAEALLMLAHCRDDSSPPDSKATHHRTTNYNSAAPKTIVSKKRSTAAVSDQNPITSEKAHECKICHKVFSSGAALGGHQTIHRRIKSSHAAINRPCNDAAGAPTTILNRISFCCKKRKHDSYEGKLGINMMICDSSDGGINNSGVTSSDEGASNTRVRLDIDLNLPPPPESC